MLTRNLLNELCQNLEFHKKAQRANPRLYDIGCYNDNLALMLAPYSDETIRLEKERRSKLSDLIRPLDYDQLNNLYDLFVPQREKLAERHYFPKTSKMSHTSSNKEFSKESFHKQTTLLEKRMDESIPWDQKCKSSKELFKIKKSVDTIFDGVERCKQTIAKRTYFGVIPTTSVSRPPPKSNQLEDRVMSNNSQRKEKKVEDHRRTFKFSNNKTSVTACNDSLNANGTLNVHHCRVNCGKCVLNENHDLCVLHYINGVNSRTRKPMAVPISTREPKHNDEPKLLPPIHAKRQKTSEYEAYVSGESSSRQVNVEEPGPSTSGNQEQDDEFGFWMVSYSSDDDEIPKLKKMADEMLRQRCTSGDEHQYHIDQMKNFLQSDIVWESKKEILVSPHPRKITPSSLVSNYQQKINLTAPTITLIGIEEYDMFSIVYEPIHGIIYTNSKKEKMVMRPSEIHKFCDATLRRTLEGLKSYCNDVKYGYVQKELTNDEVEFLKLFEEEIEVRLKYRDQMRRWEMYVNGRPLGPRRERPE
ncbi:hypothetical protein Tco_0857570 [Tanacetum coccineum]|uniref:Uncharacterized protein n=1 Tax=Tanacetum coccineum TaxID=301880 RepID=A0ABQ5B9Q0_9ASTR